LKGLKSVLTTFSRLTGDPQVHEITPGTVEQFLRSLRAKDGTSKVLRKSWNNYRNDLNKFFSWCREPDKATERPWTFEDPVGPVRKFSTRQVREEQPATPATTTPQDVQKLLSLLMRWRGGVMLRYFCYLYFTGIRPVELSRLSDREAELVNLKTAVITVPADISKTRHPRQVTIPPNLRKWLEVAPGPIIPKSFDRLSKLVRAHFKLSHDEARHSYISYHGALHRSLGDAALQAGNSETIIRQHYLNIHPREEGAAFFGLVPGPRRRCVSTASDTSISDPQNLKVV
jgi:integrase